MRLASISLNNLRRRKAKMLFLVTGLLIGIATIVTLVAITEAMSRDIEERLDQFGANIVMAPRSDQLSLSYGGVAAGGVSYTLQEFAEEDLARIRTIKDSRNLGAVAPKVLGAVTINGRQVLLMGADLAVEFNLKTWWHANGTLPSQPDQLLAGDEAARALGLHPGGSITLAGRPFTVTAILAPTGGPEDTILVGDLHTVQQILGKPGRITLVEIAAFCRDCPIEEMVLQIAEQFPDAKVTALKQAVLAKMQSIELFRSFSYGISFLVILVGSLLVFVTMMGSVNERTREIGIFRAIGFRRGHVMQIILLEALLVGLVGGTLGFAAGNGIAWLVVPLVLPQGGLAGINFSLGGVAVLLAVGLSLAASFYPAQKASRLDPSEALRAL
ncbi:MAG: FtsX-like permease family protein [Thermodesulfobacteriota bacterium]